MKQLLAERKKLQKEAALQWDSFVTLLFSTVEETSPNKAVHLTHLTTLLISQREEYIELLSSLNKDPQNNQPLSHMTAEIQKLEIELYLKNKLKKYNFNIRSTSAKYLEIRVNEAQLFEEEIIKLIHHHAPHINGISFVLENENFSHKNLMHFVVIKDAGDNSEQFRVIYLGPSTTLFSDIIGNYNKETFYDLFFSRLKEKLEEIKK